MITLPDSPHPAAISWELVDFGGTSTSSLGGSAQRINRLGNRWKVGVTMPPLTEAQAREWASALTRGLRQGVAWKLSQPGFVTGSPGTPLVAGASQLGDTLNLDGLNAGYVIRAGQWLSILTGGQRYLYQSVNNVRVPSTGIVALEIEPSLRVSPADNDPVEFAAPLIEGLLEAAPGWRIDTDHIARGFSFVIAETR